jgi:hypothetical protein
MLRCSLAALVLSAALAQPLLAAARAHAAGLLSPVCKIMRHAPLPLSLGCSAASRGLEAGRQLASGNVGAAVGGVISGATGDVASLALNAIATAAAGSAKFALDETATLMKATSTPRLQAPWFQHVYWRLAGISVLLTLPCLFAAAVHSIVRSDLALLARAAFAYLPCATLAVGVCAQVTALLLSATDELCSLVSGVAGDAAPAFLTRAGTAILGLSVASRSPFLAFVIAVFTVAGAVILWLELMMREAAVYVVVAMLPLAFAAFVWPARRVWALRAMELLSALILAKLAMVVVLTLGGAALEQAPSVAGFLAGLVLLVLGVFAPWAMLRMIPLTELASGAAGRLRAESVVIPGPEALAASAGKVAHWATAASAGQEAERGGGSARGAAESVIARMRGDRPAAEELQTAPGGGSQGGSDAAHTGEPPPHAGGLTGGLSDPEAPPDPGPGPGEESRADGGSMFDAPNNSWRELELSDQTTWRAAPLWSPALPPAAPDGGTASGSSPGAVGPDAGAEDRELPRDGHDPTVAGHGLAGPDLATPAGPDLATPADPDLATPGTPDLAAPEDAEQ